MPIRVQANPTFSWSHSRDRTLRSCERAYYWRYYGSHNGWLRDADPTTRRAWALKQLTNLAGALGEQVHMRASEIAEAIRAGGEPPPLDELIKRTRGALNRLYLASGDVRAFLRGPKSHPMLLERYYRLGPSNKQIQSVRTKMHRCLERLHDSVVWGEIRRCPLEDILLFSPTDAVDCRGIPIYAAPDLVWRCPGDLWTILDWKTGSEDDAEPQLALYGLAIRERYGLEPPFRGRIINLDSGSDREIEISTVTLRTAEERIRESIWQMRGFLVELDMSRNEARERSAFGLPINTDQCKWCNYFELCAGELDQTNYKGPF